MCMNSTLRRDRGQNSLDKVILLFMFRSGVGRQCLQRAPEPARFTTGKLHVAFRTHTRRRRGAFRHGRG